MSSIPWQDIAIGFLTNMPIFYGFSTLLVVVEQFSKMIHLVLLGEKIEAVDVATTFFQSMVNMHGLPSIIISNITPVSRVKCGRA